MIVMFPKEKKVKGRKSIEPFDISDPLSNLITIDKTDYIFTPLTDCGNKGGNALILRLFEAQRVDTSDPFYDDPDLIMKILTNPVKRTGHLKRIHKRFDREIRAIIECNKAGKQNIIRLFHEGSCDIGGSIYLFYTMEVGEYDLRSFIETQEVMTLQEKLDLCLSLARGLGDLESLKYYHRDLKPDNIFIIGNTWKIGDLGLLDKRDEDLKIDYKSEWIGPRGWMSPESMNKFLCEGKNLEFSHDYSIDHQSDIFQLGRIFCYIMQNNNPIGVFKQKDLNIKNNSLYHIIRTMLNYPKTRRYMHVGDIIELLQKAVNN